MFIFILVVIRTQEHILNGEHIIAMYSKQMCIYMDIYPYIKILFAMLIYYTIQKSNLPEGLKTAVVEIC